MVKQEFEIRKQVEFISQGSKIFGVIHQPKEKKTVPAVLFCHGLAGHKIGKHRMYVILAELLAKRGIASLRFDFRGCGDSEGNFGDMTLEGQLEDTEAAFQFLVKQPHINPNNIGIFGRSFGGAIAIMAAHRFSNIKSIALWAPVFNASQWEEKWELAEAKKLAETERQALMTINGQLPGLGFYKELFSMKLDNKLETLKNIPMLHIHGLKDPIVSIEHAAKYEAIRKNSHAPTKFIRLEQSDHDFTHLQEKSNALEITSRWFAETLLETEK
jgi:alpha-beta hydrolase superfamily lysophospholipase